MNGTRLDDGYRMAFIGDDHVAAPRLAEVDLDRATASRVWRELLDEVTLFIERDLVSLGITSRDVASMWPSIARLRRSERMPHRVARQAVIGSRRR